MKPSKKFLELFEFYKLEDGTRLEKYNAAEEKYKAKHGEYLYNDFRMFSARLSSHYSIDVPHQNAANQYEKKAL